MEVAKSLSSPAILDGVVLGLQLAYLAILRHL